MSTYTGNDDVSRESMAHGRPGDHGAGATRTAGGVSRQIDVGFFTVWKRGRADGLFGDRGVEVGMAFVEEVSNTIKIEHYVLSGEHESPSDLNDMVIEKAAGMFESRAAFFAAAREHSAGWAKVVYIKSTCEYSGAIPEI